MPSRRRSKPFVARALVTSLLLAAVADAASNDTPPLFTNARSQAPSQATWSATSPVILARAYGTRARGCEVKLSVEWLRVSCPGLKTAAVTQLGGDRREVSYFIEPAGDDRVPGAGQVTFPVRVGERRAFLFWTLGPGYDGPLTVVPAVVLQASWHSEADGPSVTLTDALHEPVATKTHPRAQPKDR
jgi:hypothetical protein